MENVFYYFVYAEFGVVEALDRRASDTIMPNSGTAAVQRKRSIER